MKRILLTVQQLEFPPEEPLRAKPAALINLIENRSASLVDGWAGFQAVQVGKAALEPARRGTWINIAE